MTTYKYKIVYATGTKTIANKVIKKYKVKLGTYKISKGSLKNKLVDVGLFVNIYSKGIEINKVPTQKSGSGSEENIDDYIDQKKRHNVQKREKRKKFVKDLFKK